jgi:hypothetical protein
MREPLQSETESAEPEPAQAAEALARASTAPDLVLRLQRTIGNAGTNRVLSRWPMLTTPAPTVEPWQSWSEKEIKAVQAELKRLRLYDLTVDGDLGRFSEMGLMEAFGNEEWRQLDAPTAISRLKAATRPKKAGGGGRTLRYAELFKDGVFDVTFGMGYKEGATEEEEFGEKSQTAVLESQLLKELGDRGFTEDPKLAWKLLAQAGRAVADPEYGRWFVKENATTYSPPAGASRKIHAVIRVLRNTKPGEGGRARAAYMESMARGDATFYSGHGRYGTGPDFDRNFLQFRLYEKKGDKTPKQVIRQYEALEIELSKGGKNPIKVFKEMVADGRLEVDFANTGNVRLVGKTPHTGEFGGYLLQWAFEQQQGGTPTVTGEGNELEKAHQAGGRRYRIVAFAGCRTADYEKALRSTPGFSMKDADVMETNRTVHTGYGAFVFGSFIDSVLAQQNRAQMTAGANKAFKEHEPFWPGTNPVVMTGEKKGPGG